MQEVTANVYNSLKESTAEIAGKRAEYEALVAKANSGRYSTKVLSKEIYPKRDALKRELADDSAKALEKATALVREYQEEMRRADNLNPADITDDVKLFTAGIKLKARDIEGIIERNKGNATMIQIALRYAEENGVDMGHNRPLYIGHSQQIQGGEHLINVIHTYGRWINTPKAAEMLDKFFNVVEG